MEVSTLGTKTTAWFGTDEKTATVTIIALIGNTSLTMTTTKAFLTGQKQQQQLCCTTKVHCISMAGSAQHNKHNKAEQSQCVDLWHWWDGTNNQSNQVIKQPDEGDGTRQIAKQQTNTVSLRHTTNTAQLKKCFTQNTFVCLKSIYPNANINRALSLL